MFVDSLDCLIAIVHDHKETIKWTKTNLFSWYGKSMTIKVGLSKSDEQITSNNGDVLSWIKYMIYIIKIKIYIIFLLNEKKPRHLFKASLFQIDWSLIINTEGQSAWNDRKYECIHINTFVQTYYISLIIISQKFLKNKYLSTSNVWRLYILK